MSICYILLILTSPLVLLEPALDLEHQRGVSLSFELSRRGHPYHPVAIERPRKGAYFAQ
jgi:hypothetical protein